MAIILTDKNRQYKRILHNTKEDRQLRQQGLEPVVSSNVSAIGMDKLNLIVRFHNGSLYSYSKKADILDRFINSPSKGEFVWSELIRKNVPYSKIGSVPLQSDREISDDDIIEEIIDTKKGNLDDIIGKDTRVNIKKNVISSIKPKKSVGIITRSLQAIVIYKVLFDDKLKVKKINSQLDFKLGDTNGRN